jgi:rhodanese-related sulfurtransferase
MGPKLLSHDAKGSPLTLRITRHDLLARLKSTSPPVLVEALGSPYWSDAHLPGALNVPPDEVDRLAPLLLPDLEAEIVVYCSNTCVNSDTTARRLTELGYRHVVIYQGGKEDWIEGGLPVERLAESG